MIDPHAPGRGLRRAPRLHAGLTWLGLGVIFAGPILAGRARAEQSSRSLTLRESIALAVRGNPTLAAAGVDVSIADANRLAAAGLDDFIVDASGTYNNSQNAILPDVLLQTVDSHDMRGEIALTKPLATGGRVGLHLVGGYSHQRSAIMIDPTMPPIESVSKDYSESLQLKFEQPLLRGFGPAVARADQRRSGVQRDVASALRLGAAATLLRDVVASYWELTFATQELNIRRAAAASAREQLLRVAANINVGKLPRSASSEVEVAIAIRDAAVLSAELTLFARAVDLARLAGITIDDTDHPMLQASDTPVPPPGLPTMSAAFDLALAHNPQLEALRGQGAAAAIDVEVTDNGLLPQLDVALFGGPTGDAATASASYSQITQLKGYAEGASLVFQEPIERRAARGARDAALQRLMKVRLNEQDILAQVRAAVAQGVAAVSSAERQGEVLARSIEVAQTDLDAEKARFEGGRSTSFDVLRRQDALATVQLALLRARVDHLKALAGLQAATGEILAVYGMVVP